VHFKERYRDTAAREEKSKHSASWSPADDTTGSFFDVTNFRVLDLGICSDGGRGHDPPPWEIQFEKLMTMAR